MDVTGSTTNIRTLSRYMQYKQYSRTCVVTITITNNCAAFMMVEDNHRHHHTTQSCIYYHTYQFCGEKLDNLNSIFDFSAISTFYFLIHNINERWKQSYIIIITNSICRVTEHRHSIVRHNSYLVIYVFHTQAHKKQTPTMIRCVGVDFYLCLQIYEIFPTKLQQ